MKNEYKKPVVKMIDYAYQEQVVASSTPMGNIADSIGNGMCTYFDSGCFLVYTSDLCLNHMAIFPTI